MHTDRNEKEVKTMNVFLVIILILIVLEIIKIGVKVALGTMKFAFKFTLIGMVFMLFLILAICGGML